MKEKILINRIEEITGEKYDSPKDFARLSDLIHAKTGERISSSTLKRLWGYVRSDTEPRTYTLDVLARFVGYKDFDDFLAKGSSRDVQSDIAFGDKISCEYLPIGAMVRLYWLPDRMFTIRHLGDGQFKVTESINSKLSCGDTFTCFLIINHDPAFFDKLSHDGKGPYVYVAGKRDGVTVEVLPDDHAAGTATKKIP